MMCLCTAWTGPLFWIWLYASEEVSSKLIQIWAHRSQLASPCAKELQCAYGTGMVFVRWARTNYHSLPRICFYISLLTLFQSNCFLFLVGRTTLDSFIVVADELKKNHVYFCFLLALTRWEVSLVSSVSADAWVCLFSLISMATSVVCLVPFICVKHYLVHFVK